MIKDYDLIETTERLYRLLQQSKNRQINAEKQLQQTIANQDASIVLPHVVDTETKITRLDDSEFIEVQEGVELLPLWGDSQVGASGVMIRFAPNISQKIYYQNVCFAMVISGEVKFWEKADVKLLRTGDSWTQEAESSLHIESCPTKETILIYVHCDRRMK